MLPLQVYESWMNDHIIKKVLSDPEGHIRLEKVCFHFYCAEISGVTSGRA